MNSEYESADSSYYAAEASEPSHTSPPTVSYYSGHHLKAAHVIIRNRVHPAVVARLEPLKRFPDVALYAVPLSPDPCDKPATRRLNTQATKRKGRRRDH